MNRQPARSRTTPAPPSGVERRVHVIQGEYHVTDDPDVVLTTLLGSCVAACLRDPLAGVGGMNHFLLPEGSHANSADPAAVRYGAHLMELLINGLLRLGARRDRLEAKLFGGARVISGLTDVGTKNAEFAERYLQAESIAVMPGSLRGMQGRRVQFWPVSGRVRQLALAGSAKVFEAERRAPPPPAADFGEIELF